jgi:hypothetical protein
MCHSSLPLCEPLLLLGLRRQYSILCFVLFVHHKQYMGDEAAREVDVGVGSFLRVERRCGEE